MRLEYCRDAGILTRREKINMKSFFEDLGRKIGETAETVTNKAGEAVEVQRLKNQIRALERGNERDYMELGKTVYEHYRDGEVVDAEAISICEAIQNREESIEKYERDISDVKGDVACDTCGKYVAKDMSFCPYCGAKVPEGTAEEGTDYSEAMKEKAANAAETVKDKTVDAAESMKEKAEDAAEKVTENTSHAADAVKEKAADMAEAVKEKTAKTAEDVKEKTADAAEAVKEKTADAAEAVKEKTADAAESIKEKAIEAAELLKEKAEEAEEKVRKMTED